MAEVEIIDNGAIRDRIERWQCDKDSEPGTAALQASLARIPNARARQFLTAYVRIGTITGAAEASGVHHSSHYRWLEKDLPGYRDAFELCRNMVLAIAEGELFRRAVWGRKEDVWYGGEVVGSRRVYSDRLLEFLLRALDPDKYSEKRQISGPSGGPVEISFVDPRDAD